MSGMYELRPDGLKHNPSLSSPPPPPTTPAAYLSSFTSGFTYRVLSHPNKNELVFEMGGVDVSFANALRRIMISEVPTVAIETVYIDQNTSITHDEVLSHRLGLIPLMVDPRQFSVTGPGEEDNEQNTLVFNMDVRAPSNADEGASKGRKATGGEDIAREVADK
ncbi:hypothetical protein TeGR_g4264 [Tetraparma gracilis]|uniref:DNA-directed RNA polymerase RpoA/D/Rpb3-type domain-containing protein n=1 Tax=Tetraparma gracilis TaxID=2962635 RepID=A0ABQ6N8Y1_9STRA|nr:hypothetical protein TeGR_g4264 [Tetraparma gracilis]